MIPGKLHKVEKALGECFNHKLTLIILSLNTYAAINVRVFFLFNKAIHKVSLLIKFFHSLMCLPMFRALLVLQNSSLMQNLSVKEAIENLRPANQELGNQC